MSFVIPTTDYPNSTQVVRLDGRDYTLRLVWNQRAERWSLDLLDDDEEPIIQGVALMVAVPLLRWKRFDPRTPPGELIAVDVTNDGSPPGLDELGPGKRVELTYFPATSE
jgi:hypothetical protein